MDDDFKEKKRAIANALNQMRDDSVFRTAAAVAADPHQRNLATTQPRTCINKASSSSTLQRRLLDRGLALDTMPLVIDTAVGQQRYDAYNNPLPAMAAGYNNVSRFLRNGVLNEKELDRAIANAGGSPVSEPRFIKYDTGNTSWKPMSSRYLDY